MKIWVLFFTLVCVLFLNSCSNEAKVQVTNKVHNVRLDNISFLKIKVGTYLLPGETVEQTISDHYKEISFPVSAQLEFYMVKGDKRVYLRTKEYYRINKDETLTIAITDDTQPLNPMNE
jgi:hypothetical protein